MASKCNLNTMQIKWIYKKMTWNMDVIQKAKDIGLRNFTKRNFSYKKKDFKYSKFSCSIVLLKH